MVNFPEISAMIGLQSSRPPADARQDIAVSFALEGVAPDAASASRRGRAAEAALFRVRYTPTSAAPCRQRLHPRLIPLHRHALLVEP
jgi:hypothetical protein